MNVKKIEKDYKAGVPKKQILVIHEITMGQLNYLITKNKWRRSRKGNKYAKGNKGGHGTIGNQNALVTGAYSKLLFKNLSEDEKLIYSEELCDKKQLLINDLKLLEIRELRMLSRIKEITEENEKLIVIKKTTEDKKVTVEMENNLILIERLENALTRIQDTKRKTTDSIHRIEIEHEKLELDKNRLKENVIEENAERIEIINDLPTEIETEVNEYD